MIIMFYFTIGPKFEEGRQNYWSEKDRLEKYTLSPGNMHTWVEKIRWTGGEEEEELSRESQKKNNNNNK